MRIIEKIMMVVVEVQHELFALMVDAVGDVLSLADEPLRESALQHGWSSWRSVAAGVFQA
jgi:chemotaxis signal transduction protein